MVVAVVMPLWASYLIKAYSWRLILAEDGVLDWVLKPFGLTGPGYGDVAVWLVFVYLWLPYMILPIFAGLERIPSSLLEASADLGGRGWITFRRVILPLSIPAVVAGSIFTFSLTLGDYIVPGPRLDHPVHRQRHLRQRRPEPAARGRVLAGPARDHAALPVHRPAPRRLRGPVMSGGLGPHRPCGSRRGLVLAFIYVPLTIVVALRLQRERHDRPGRRRASRSSGSARRSPTPASSRRS